MEETGYLPAGTRRGISIVEMVVAVAIVVVFLAVAYPVITRSHFLVRRGRDHYLAVAIGLASIEMARKQDYPLLPRLAESQRLVNDQGNYDGAGRFRRTITVRPDTPVRGVTEVVVDIDIRDRRSGQFLGETEHVALLYTTYLKVR